mmetsp:Transcript_10666/g.29539  ORF Transcript_10666/g.29539 Transcript_10666/m.29539 type:complete len:113 (-) Transcript_10666:3973-4311(-)
MTPCCTAPNRQVISAVSDKRSQDALLDVELACLPESSGSLTCRECIPYRGAAVEAGRHSSAAIRGGLETRSRLNCLASKGVEEAEKRPCAGLERLTLMMLRPVGASVQFPLA